MQAELLLVSRDLGAIAWYLPLMNRTLALIESRRDDSTGLLLAGQSSNLLAPSYGAWLQPNGTRTRAFMSGLAISYVAALDRVASLATLANLPDAAAVYALRGSATLAALSSLLAPSGEYFVRV